MDEGGRGEGKKNENHKWKAIDGGFFDLYVYA